MVMIKCRSGLFFFVLVKLLVKLILASIYFMYLMISVYNECVICYCDGDKILRPQHFVTVCELTSIHDDMSSRVGIKVRVIVRIAYIQCFNVATLGPRFYNIVTDFTLQSLGILQLATIL